MQAHGVRCRWGCGVSWACRHKRQGAVLALIALVLQVALTFGHVHLHGLSGSSPRIVAGQASLAHPPLQPPAQTPSDNDDYCAICASIFLASSAFGAAATACPGEFPTGRALAQWRKLSRATAAARFPIARSAHGLKLRSC